jgi:hypothetical protein
MQNLLSVLFYFHYYLIFLIRLLISSKPISTKPEILRQIQLREKSKLDSTHRGEESNPKDWNERLRKT